MITRKSFLIIVTPLAAGLCILGFYYGRFIPFEKQWPSFEALRNTASIIFAVVGAWLAIIYPERLKISFGRKSSGVDSSTSESMKLLMTPAIHSTFILAILLLVGILVPIIKQIEGVLKYIEICRGISFFILVSLTVWQIAIVLLTLYPGEIVQSSLEEAEDKKTIDDSRNTNRRVIK